MLSDQPFTTAARRHAALLAQAIAPIVDRLERRYAKVVSKRGFEPGVRKAFAAITPAAMVRLRGLPRFLEQVEYNGRRLAKWNVPLAAIEETLGECMKILDAMLDGRFGPSREQIHLATVMALGKAFYQVREAETQALFGIYHAAADAVTTPGFLRRLVQILTRTLRAEAGRLMVLGDGADPRLSVPLYIVRGGVREKLIADPAMRGQYASYWSYPLDSRTILQLGFAVPYPWMPRELALLEAASERVRAVLGRSVMEAQVRRLEAESQRLEEEERRRIGRDLHDDSCQALAALRLELEMMEKEAAGPLRGRLRKARGVTERTLSGLRRVVSALSPAVLERLGLTAALRQLGARFSKTHKTGFRMRVSGPASTLPQPFQEVIYRVAQESLQNVAKHSQAKHVNLSLVVADKRVRLRVGDDGAGFEAKMAEKKRMSFGLTGMQERAALVGAALGVRSSPGRGTAVTLEWPQSSLQVAANGKNPSTTY